MTPIYLQLSCSSYSLLIRFHVLSNLKCMSKYKSEHALSVVFDLKSRYVDDAVEETVLLYSPRTILCCQGECWCCGFWCYFKRSFQFFITPRMGSLTIIWPFCVTACSPNFSPFFWTRSKHWASFWGKFEICLQGNADIGILCSFNMRQQKRTGN